MWRLLFTLLLVALGGVAEAAGLALPESADSAAEAAGWKLALPGWRYEFPRDHGAHRDFKTEWWYFTGNVRDSRSGRELGYELVFFRQGIRPPTAPRPDASRFAVDDFKFAHAAVSDLTGTKFAVESKVTRGAFAEAGAGESALPGERLVWIEDWQLVPQADGTWHLTAKSARLEIDLIVQPRKEPVIHGVNGVSQKAVTRGHASHYYSFTRLETRGRLVLGGSVFEVTGSSWFDHEWSSSALAEGQVGWDWFCAQLEDGTELMLYALRHRDGSIDPASSGTIVESDGAVTHLRREDFTLRPLRKWKSPRTSANYPVAWEIEIPSRATKLRVETPLPGQELALGVINYWEGAVRLLGTREGRELRGVGYLEMTGYAGELRALK